MILFCLLTSTVNAEENSIDSPIGQEAESVEMEQSYTFGNYIVGSITPWCSFEERDSSLQIFPYYSSDKHIIMKDILVSGIPFWDCVKKSDSNIVTQKIADFEVLTFSNGKTIAYKESEETCLIIQSDTLPSSYVIEVLQNVN